MSMAEPGSSTTRKGATKKAATKKAAKKKPSSSSPRPRTAPRAEADRPSSAATIARQGMDQLIELTGKEPEGLVGLEQDGNSWKLRVEVVEVRRIPDTTDILALYEVEIDGKGQLQGYRRVRRYARGVPDED
jgi:hypothetical protein